MRDVTVPFVDHLSRRIEDRKPDRGTHQSQIIHARSKRRLESDKTRVEGGYRLWLWRGHRLWPGLLNHARSGNRNRHHDRRDGLRFRPREVKNKRDEQGKREHADDNVFDHRAKGSAGPTFPHREKHKSLQRLHRDAFPPSQCP